jgi:predicted Zn-dependent protease with MMP-like domain
VPEPGAERANPFTEIATADRGEPDYYAVLGLRPDASADDIRHAFHQLAKLWHPDRYMQASPELRARAERRMRALVAAHEVLDDPIKRRAYDLRHGYADAAPSSVVYTAHATHIAHSHEPAHHTGPELHVSSPHAASDQTSGTPGAGMFLALICGVLGLGILARTLADPGPGPGAVVAYAVVLGLAALAIWCLRQDSAPARLADHWMAYAHPMYPPPVRATPFPGHPHHAHRGHHSRHSRHAKRAQHTQHTQNAQHTEQAQQVHTPPPETKPTAFERLVDEALATIPSQFQPYLENVAVRVAAEPTEEQLQSVGAREGGFLLGLYQGVNLTHQGAAGAGPEWITIFQGPIERYCRHQPDRIREQVRRTVLHELAHHFGIDHEDMPDWIR